MIHAYFDNEPTDAELVELRSLGSGDPEIEHLEDSTDWVTKSQQGLRPIRAGRFFVHTKKRMDQEKYEKRTIS